MTLRNFLSQASKLKDELLDKEVVVRAENGLLMSPEIKFIPKEIGDMDKTKDSIDKIIISY